MRQRHDLNEAILKRAVFLFEFLLAPAFLAACTIWSPVTLFNNTGEAIKLDMGGNITAVTPNQFVQFRYPRASVNWVFRLADGGCEYLYDIPELPQKHDWPIALLSSDREGKIQVEKDFSLNLLPPSYAGSAPASGELFLKQKGFPLQPVSRKCR
jgi:hypothetical protein